MRKSRVIATILALVVMSMGLASCSLFMVNTNENVVESPVVEKTVEINYPLEVKDSDGKMITLEAVPEKVISLGPNMTELVYALGQGDRLVGVTTYCDYPEEALEVEKIGSLQEPDFEKIAELAPDLVLASTHVGEETMKKLEELKIPTLTLYDERNLEGLHEIILTLGDALNCPTEAQALAEDCFTRIDAVRSAVNEEARPSLYYVVGFGEYGDFTAGGDTFVNDIIEAAGAKNIAADIEGWSYSIEKLIEEDPDMIVIPAWAEESFGKEAPYSDLTAVKEGRVFTIDNNMIDRQCHRNADAVEALAELVAEVIAPESVKPAA